MVEQYTIEIDAETLDEALEQIQTQIPHGLQLLTKFILSDGNPTVVSGIGLSTDDALADARTKVPPDGVIIEERKVHDSFREHIIVEAFDEFNAKIIATESFKRRFGDNIRITSIDLVSSGARGFLGIGAKPHRYDVAVGREALVEVIFKTKAKIRIVIGKEPEQDKLRRIKSQMEQNDPDVSTFFKHRGSKAIYDWLRLNEGELIRIVIEFSDYVPDPPRTKKIEGIWRIKKPSITIDYHQLSLVIIWELAWNNEKYMFSTNFVNYYGTWGYPDPTGSPNLSLDLNDHDYSVISHETDLIFTKRFSYNTQEDVEEGRYARVTGKKNVEVTYTFILFK